MIDHITLRVRDIDRSIRFYRQALAPLGYVVKAHHEPTLGFGVDDGTPRSDFYVSPIEGHEPTERESGDADAGKTGADRDDADRADDERSDAGNADEEPSMARRPTPVTHIAFRARDQAAVHAFYEAALKAGGTGNGAPGPRPYHPGYYAAFVLDPDGNNIEAVVDWAGSAR
ncbi:VOC family protein [uncultured Bifidobacterium sp.]|uniref:VOC family protein n=1 Tax=uncultured Bifidobacterium sp. TaxID=165187 RepID=UPI0028DB07C9|nr:VOC family protein [uncultured Bifidobacterium sp.]